MIHLFLTNQRFQVKHTKIIVIKIFLSSVIKIFFLIMHLKVNVTFNFLP